MSNVAKLDQYRARDTIQTLKALLAHAQKGHITGLAIAWQCRTGELGTSTTGSYAQDHISALGATGKLFCRINEQADSQVTHSL